jgi:vacuolar-type H+-ATPase subunit H
MQEHTKPLEELVKELPSDCKEEVRDFVEFLLEKRARKQGRKLRQDWAGTLKDYRDQYTALELQQEASEWRTPVLSPKKQKRLDLLLDRANEGKLTPQQSQELEQLIEEAQLLTIRKARLLADALAK